MAVRTMPWRGIVLALASALLFGASTPTTKILLGNVEPWMLASLLYLGAGFGLAVVFTLGRLSRSHSAEAPIRWFDVPWLLAVTLTGGVLGPVLLMFGLARTDAASASLLLNLESLATLSIAWLVFRESVDRRLLLGTIAILAGAGLLVWSGGFRPSWGAVLIAAARLAWGIDNNLTRKLSATDPVQIVMLKGTVAGVVNVVLAFYRGQCCRRSLRSSLSVSSTFSATG